MSTSQAPPKSTGSRIFPLPRLERRAAALLTLLYAAGITACEWDRPAVEAAAAGATAERLDPQAVEAWADEVFGQMLQERRFSALALAVTQGDEVVLQKGYGYSDWVRKTPVDPETSQFRIGSLTKTFLATALAQLVERGEIGSLDDPVNQYLRRFQIESPFPEEITIWDLVTHQGGFGTAAVFVPESEAPRPVPPLPAEYIRASTPPVVREPGTLSIYCNPCSATLGFMIEDITGRTLESYFRENIYEPLGLTRTTLTNVQAQPPDVVTQYAFASDGSPVALPYPAITPYISYAGDMNSTAGDMARWLIAHVQAGRGDGPAILEPRSFELMHARKRGNHPDASGFGIQFFAYEYNGEPIIEHYGSIRFRSMEIMMLDREIGVFVTMAGGGEAPEGDAASGPPDPPPGPIMPELSHSGVRAVVLEHFLGPLPLASGETPDVSRYTGVYHGVPADPNAEPRGRGRTVEASGDGGLIIGGLGVYRPSGPDTFTLDGPLPLEAGFGQSNRYVFAPGPNGRMRMFAHVNAGAFERVEE